VFADLTIAQKVADFFEHSFQGFYMKIKGTQPGATHHSLEGVGSVDHGRGSVQ
jgi:hypothetical protein